MGSIVVGILAFQGDFSIHRQAFEALGCKVKLIKDNHSFSEIDCLVIPGGESSVIFRFIASEQLAEPIKEFAEYKPIWGTCAGMILLAKNVLNDSTQSSLGLIDIDVNRNGFGRQYESFVDKGEINFNKAIDTMEMVFIRAPRITRIGENVSVLGQWQQDAVIVQENNVIATSFHPELTESTIFQQYLLSMIT